MNIKDRFLDYCNTTEFDNYHYNLSIFECMIYGVCEAMGGTLRILFFMVLLILIPIWSIPYLIYKNYQIKKEDKNEIY